MMTTNPSTNRHIFISYSRSDKEIVKQLIRDLQNAGITVWLDTQDLKPGTHNWEEALRSALASAYAVLLIASPSSRRSPYVQDELAIGQMFDCPIYPVWVDGTDWIDCIPLGMGKMQYVDARANNYQSALTTIIASLRGEAEKTDEESSLTIPVPGYVPPNPYKGLEAFTEEDSDRFFGRENFTNKLIESLDQQLRGGGHRLMAIVGASGSGKSSVVMAGLLPRLRDGALPGSNGWRYLARLLPGSHPIENLANTLYAVLPNKTIASIEEDLLNPSGTGLHRLASQIVKLGSRVVLYIDQFEELFTQTVDEKERQQFIDLIVTAATEPDGAMIIVLTLRADFYDRPLNYPGLGQLLEQTQPVLPMSLADLYDAVQKPADKVSLKFDDNLVASLVFDVRDQLGGLPLLQFTLDRLYELRDGRKLTMQAYRQIGGVRGALADHAEATYNKLPTDQHKRFARALFLRLIEPGATEQDTTRRRAALSELVLPDAQESAILREVADRFVRARLLVTNKIAGEDTIEVGHEALIREWETLAVWLHDAREDIRFQKAIAADAAEWVRRDRPTDMLYRGTRLDDAQHWAQNNAVSRAEREFIDASLNEQEQQRQRDAKIARRVQNFQRASVVLGIFVVVAVITALLLSSRVITAQAEIQAVGQTITPAVQTVQAADTQIANARVEQQSAINSQQTAQVAVTQANSDAQAARTQAAVAAQTLTPIGITLAAGDAQLAEAQTQIAGVQPTLDGAETQVAGVEPTLDSAETQIAGVEPTLLVAQTQVAGAGTQVAESGLTLTPIPATLTPVALTLAAGDQQLAEARGQIDTANQLAAAAETQVAQSGLTLTPVAQTLVAGDAQLVEAREQIAGVAPTLALAQTQVAGAETQVAESGLTLTPIPETLTPVAQTLVAGDAQLAEARGQIDTANQLAAAAETQAAQSAQTLTPIPQTLAAANNQVDAARTEVAGVQPTLNSAETQIAGVQPTLDNAETQIAGVQPTLNSAETQVAGVEPTLVFVEQRVQQQSDLADSFRLSVAAQNLLLVGNPDLAISLMLEAYRLNPFVVETQRVLNAAIPQTVRLNLNGATRSVNTFSPDGRYFVATDNGSSLVIWDIANRREAQRFDAGSPVTALLFSPPNGRYLASGLNGGGIIIWDVEAGTLRFELRGHRARVLALAFSIDGNRLLSGAEDYKGILWNLESGQEIARMEDHEAPVAFVNFNANATKAFTYDFGRQTATTRFIPRVTVYDLVTNTDFIQTPPTYRGLSPNGEFAFTGGDGIDFFTLWNPSQSIKSRIFQLGNANEDYINQIAFSEDNRSLLVHVETRAYGANQSYVVTDRYVALWDIQTGAEIRRFQVREENPRNWDVTSITLSNNGQLALTGGRYGSIYTVTLWDVSTGEELRRFTGHGAVIERVGFDPNANYAFSYSNGSSRVWDITTELYQSRKIDLNVDSFMDYGLSADGGKLFIAYNDTSISTWNFAAGAEDTETRMFTAAQNQVAFSPTQPYALVSGAEGTVLWDVEREERVYRLEGIDDALALDFSSDGRYAAIATAGGIVIWDVENGGATQRWNFRNAEFVKLYFNQYVLAAQSNTIQLYDAVENRVINEFTGFSGRVNDIAFSPTGDKVVAAIGEPDNAVILWDIATGNQDFAMVGHNDNVRSVAFSPDGRTVISGSDDTSVILWDVATGQSVTAFNGHTAPVINLKFTPDGSAALSASQNPEDGILVWQIRSVQDTVNWVYANRYVLQLDCTQRVQYNVRPACLDGVAPTLTPTFTPQATFTPTATSTLRPTFTPTATPIPTGRLIGDAQIRMRTGPSTNFDILTQVSPGIVVEIVEVTADNGWTKIRLPNGTEGWISSSFIDR